MLLNNTNLKIDEHRNETVNNVNRRIGVFKRKLTYMDKNVFVTLYKALV